MFGAGCAIGQAGSSQRLPPSAASRLGRLAILMLLTVPCAAQAPQPEFTVVSDVQYCTGGGAALLMDVFLPKQRVATPTPAVLWIHGGGWEHGDKSARSGAEFLAAAGFVTASLSYRLSGAAPFPAAIQDCKCAIRFLRANAARYGIDAERIGVAGSSAGGHLAELVATAGERAGLEGDGGWPGVSSRVQAAASYYGVSDLTAEFPADTVPYLVKFLGGALSQKPGLYRRASPIFYVARGDPPLLLVHGTNDDGVPVEQSVRMTEAYRQAGLPVEFIQVQNAGHDFQHVGSAPISPSVEAIHHSTVEFFKRNLLAGQSASGDQATVSAPPGPRSEETSK
jgi:acetyl esterase/lipase